MQSTTRYRYAIVPIAHHPVLIAITSKLYGSLSREELSILAQARIGFTYLNFYLFGIKAVEYVIHRYGLVLETVEHVLLYYRQ